MSEREMEGEDSVRTVDCLRGRLLAERAASRDAKAEAEQLLTKLMELENLLKEEAKSRNRAEKKLRFLMKKLESMNILHVSDDSEHSGLIDKIDISSISSSTASSTIKHQENNENQQTKSSEVFQAQESKGGGNLKQIDSQSSSFSLTDDSSTAEGTSISSAFEGTLPGFEGLECEMGRDESATSPRVSEPNEDSSSSASERQSERSSLKIDQPSDLWYESTRSSSSSEVDDSMALVVVEKSHSVDLDATVREVLNTLRLAKEKLQSSMARSSRGMKMIGGGAILI